MIDAIEVEPGDRVLLLSIPSPAEVAGLARRLTAGLVVGLGNSDEVSVARREAREFHNAMFVPAAPDDIPWQDGFFDRVIGPGSSWPAPAEAREIARVLTPGGFLYLGTPSVPAEALPGLVPAGQGADGFLSLRREP